MTDNINAKATSEHRNHGIAKCRAYRLKQKAQFDELLEANLNQELLRLQRVWKKKKAALDSTRTPAYLLWRDLAVRLRAERKHAESQNEKLRYVVNNQAMYISTLREVLEKTTRGLVSNIDYNGYDLGKHLVGMHLNSYIQEIEQRFSETNEVLNAFDSSAIYNVECVDKQGAYSVVKLHHPRSRHVLPFSLSETGNTMWKLGKMYFSNKEHFMCYPIVNDPDNTFAAGFVDSIVLKTGEEFKKFQRIVIRRFVQDNQIVFVWRIIFDGEGIIRGVRAEETGWCRLLPSGDLWEPGTVLAMCVHRGLIGYDDSSPPEPSITTYSDQLTKVSREVLADIANSLENVLLKTHIDDGGSMKGQHEIPVFKEHRE